MKPERIIISLAISLFVALTSGCGQKDSTATSESEDAQKTLSSAAADTREAAEQAAKEVKQASDTVIAGARQTATDATAAATGAVDGVKAETQGLIDKTKTYISEKRYEDALTSLKQLSNFSLTPEQQKTVNDLKAQLEKLMSSQVVTNASSALNNLLKK